MKYRIKAKWDNNDYRQVYNDLPNNSNNNKLIWQSLYAAERLLTSGEWKSFDENIEGFWEKLLKSKHVINAKKENIEGRNAYYWNVIFDSAFKIEVWLIEE